MMPAKPEGFAPAKRSAFAPVKPRAGAGPITRRLSEPTVVRSIEIGLAAAQLLATLGAGLAFAGAVSLLLQTFG